MPRALRPLWQINLRSLLGRGPVHAGPVSDHFDGERFRNLEPKARKRLLDVLRWRLNRERQDAWTWQQLPGPTAQPPARVTGEALRVTYVNHATLLIQHRGLNVLTDPLWSPRASPLPFLGPKRWHAPGVALDALPPIDLILVSHNHYDHLDLPTLRRLAERFPLARVASGLGNGALIRAAGFSRVAELDWWQPLALADGLELHAVPAQHWSSRGLGDSNRTLWLGFVLASPDGPLLFPGDTGFGPEFGLVRQRFGPLRFAALPIGAYAPRWFMRDSHMDPDEAVRAHLILEARRSMAIHFGTFNLSDENQFAPAAALDEARRRHGVDAAAFAAPLPGEAWMVG
jgi:L-ascorbate metabolism protein UlaG (beta-lactamase superfamily)